MIGSATVAEYLADRGLRLKTERLLEIIGEAIYRAERSEPDLADQIPELREVTGLRNRIDHGYDAISDETVWKAASVGVPELQQRVDELLEREGELPVD